MITTPCPFMNTLQNEKLISPDTNVFVLARTIYNLDIFDTTTMCLACCALSGLSFDTPIYNITDLEHDVSLTRNDIYNGNNISYNKTLFNRLKKLSTDGKYITLDNLNTHKKKQFEISKRENPTLKFGTKEFIQGCMESSVLFLLFSDKTNNLRIDWAEYFLSNEQFPVHIGWKLKRIVISDFINTIYNHITTYNKEHI